MSGFSTHFKNYSLSQITALETFLALVTTPVDANDDGSDILEPNSLEYSTYTRMSLAPSDWSVPTEGEDGISVVNTNPIIFPTCTQSANTLIVGYALCDALYNGNVIVSGDFDAQYINNGITPIFPPSTLMITLS